jgi:hypothetical protein
MIQLVLFLAAGAAFLFLLLVFLRRGRPHAEDSGQAILEARNALHTLRSGLLPLDLIRKLFSHEDYDYIVSSASPAIQSAFLKERKQLALAWVGQVQSQLVSLRLFHREHSRFYTRLSPWTELSLAANFSVLLLECRILTGLLYLRGPYASPRLVGRTVAATARVCAVTEKSFDFLTLAAAGHPAGPRSEDRLVS